MMSQQSPLPLHDGGYCYSSLLLFTEDDFANVHPDDLSAVRANYPRGWQLLCFRYGGRHSVHDVLDDGEVSFRVQNAVIEPIPAKVLAGGWGVFCQQTVGWRCAAGQLAPQKRAGILLR